MTKPQRSSPGRQMPHRPAFLVAALLFWLLALSACGSGSDAPAPPDQASDAGAPVERDAGAQVESVVDAATDVTGLDYPIAIDESAAEAVERIEVGGMTSLPFTRATSLVTLAGSHEYIVVARVTSMSSGYPLARSAVAHFIPETPLPPDDPKANITPDPDGRIGPVGSQYKLEVVRTIQSSDLAVGDSFAITAWGGKIDGVRYESAGDPLLEVGTTYLLFLERPHEAAFTSLPFGRYKISSDGRLQRVTTQFDVFDAVSSLSGLGLDEAITKIDDALVEYAKLLDAENR